MPISSTVRKAGPFTGNDTTTNLPFYFKIFSEDELRVVKFRTATSVETTLALTTDYSVTLNDDQETYPGGVVSLNDVLLTGYTATIWSDVDYLQPVELINLGAYYPEVINDEFDRLTILTQQLKQTIDDGIEDIANDISAQGLAGLSITATAAEINTACDGDTAKNSHTHAGVVPVSGETYVTTFAELAAAVVGTATNIVMTPGTYTMTADLYIPNTIEVYPMFGVAIVTTGHTLTIGRWSRKTDRYPLFSGSGTVVFGNASCNQIFPEWWGSTSAAMQSAFDASILSGIPVFLTPYKNYVQTVPLTFLRSSSGQAKNRVIVGNNAILDWSATPSLISGTLLKAGASAETYAADTGKLQMGDFEIKGPQPDWTTPTGTVVGLNLEYALNVDLKPIMIQYCYKGYRTYFSFPITSDLLIVRNCSISAHIDSESTCSVYKSPQFVQTYLGLLLKTETTTGSIGGQAFWGPRIEDAYNGIHLDSARTISNISIYEPRYESITNDLLRVGITYNFSNPVTTRGAASANDVMGIRVIGGLWDSGNFSANHMAMVFASTKNCYGGTFLGLPFLKTGIVNRPYKSVVQLANDPHDGQGSTVSFEYPGHGFLTFNGSTLAVSKYSGNLSTVARHITGGNPDVGYYELPLLDTMSDDDEYGVQVSMDVAGSCFVFARDNNTVSIKCVDPTGTAIDPTWISVIVDGILA